MRAKGDHVATVTDRLEEVLEREAPVWGIRPVPPEHRRLSGFDFAVLWGDLSIGLLVLLTGALLVPSLGFPEALLAIVVGTLIGCVPLALVALAGSRENVPTMVLFRPVLGIRGSYLPSVLNIVQLVGWTGFEFWAMSLVANQMSIRVFGYSNKWLWLGVVALVCTILALGGPILVVRRWLERFGAWVVAGVGAWITFQVLHKADLGHVWNAPGSGGFPGHFWLAVDLVIAMPVSWLPLVADYNRFARSRRGSVAGTYVGYSIGNIWFYALGALLVLGAGLPQFASPAELATAMASLAGGAIVLLTLLVGETDEAFADVYSAAVSSQNLSDRIPQRGAIVAIAAAGAGLAAWLFGRPDFGLGSYELFLLLLGSVFVPLIGVFVADYFVLGRRGYREDELFDGTGQGRSFRPVAMIPWAVGFLVYQWSVPSSLGWWSGWMHALFHGVLHLPFPLWGSAAGGSIPSFLVAFVLALVMLGPTRRRSAASAGAPQRSAPLPGPSTRS
jgi:putative hydroxymethylpyrimidine transporter CytX